MPEREIPGQERAGLEDADDHGGAQAQTLDALVRGIVLLVSQHRRAARGSASLVATPEHLGREEDSPVDDEEHRGGSGIAEQRLQRVLEEEADDPGRDGADDQHDRQALVRIVDPTPHRRPEEPDDDPRPVAPVQEEQRRGGPEMEDREHGHERRDWSPGS